MAERIGALMVTAFFGFLVYAIGMSQGQVETENHWHRITIERGLAQYCPDDGAWAWIGECDHD